MKLFDSPIKSFVKMGRLEIFVNAKDDFILAMPGQEIKRGKAPFDIHVDISTAEAFNKALETADKSDAYSHMLSEVFKQEIK